MGKIQTGYLPGAIGRITELHGRFYAENWQFGVFFEAKLASGLAEFMLRYDPSRDAMWSVIQNNRLEGSITIDGLHGLDPDQGAHLRWFIMSDALRGQGFGNRLLDAAIQFCRDQHYPSIHLSTFAGLHAARKLYENAGFILTHEQRGAQWGTEVTEQKFVLDLSVGQ